MATNLRAMNAGWKELEVCTVMIMIQASLKYLFRLLSGTGVAASPQTLHKQVCRTSCFMQSVLAKHGGSCGHIAPCSIQDVLVSSPMSLTRFVHSSTSPSIHSTLSSRSFNWVLVRRHVHPAISPRPPGLPCFRRHCRKGWRQSRRSCCRRCSSS